MADGGNRLPSEAVLVETVLSAVYGRGQVSVERSYEMPLDVPEPDGLTLLGSHATNGSIQDVAIITTADGGKQVKATGAFDLLLWVKVGGGTRVVGGSLTFSEDIPLQGPTRLEYRNETASARFLAAPETGSGQAFVRDGRAVAVVPVRLSLAAEMAGEARVFVYAGPSP